MSPQEVYLDCLSLHALRWLEIPEPRPSALEYIELNAGPVLSHFIRERSPNRVLEDLIERTKKIA